MLRLDRGTLQSKIKPRLIEGKVARLHAPGDGLQYLDGPEHRDISELQKIVDQLTGLRVVTYAETDSENPLGHPNGLLADGTDYHEIGMVMGGRIEGDHAVASIYIHDVGALKAIEDGTRELSLGYRCTLDEQKYQRNIQLDHLSVVPRARCGASCALKTDAVPEPVAQTVPPASLDSMQTIAIKLSDETIDQLAAIAPACNCHANNLHANESMLNSDGAQMEEKLIEALAKVATLEAEVSTLKSVKTDEADKLTLAQDQLKVETARADKFASEIEAAKTDALAQVAAAKAVRSDADQKEFDAAVDARVGLLAAAASVGVEDYTSKTNKEIKIAVVAKVDGVEVDPTRPDIYVDGMYDLAMSHATKAAESVAAVRTAVVEKRDDAAVVTVSDPYKKEQELSAATEAKRKNRWR